MATEVGAIKYTLDLDKRGFDEGIDESSKKAKGFGAGLESAKTGSFALLGGLTAAAAGAVAFGIKSVQAFSESQNVMAQTKAVIESTGGVAGVTAEQVGKMASELQRVTTFSDETIQSGENLLLTFTNIGKDIFPEATKTMLDMSQALGQDTKSSAIQLGKALQDPILGVTALRRVGVNFNEQQQEQIKTLVESGKSLDAQKLILKELKTEFGGSAEAAGKTFAGSLERAKNTFGDFMELVGSAILTRIQPLVDGFNQWFDSMGGPEGVLQRITILFGQLAPHLPLIIGGILGGLVPAFIALGGAILTTMLPLVPFIAAGVALAFLVQQLINHFGGFNETIKAFQPFVQGLMQVFQNLGTIFQTFILPILVDIWNQIRNQLWPALQQLWNTIAPVLIPTLKVLGTIIGITLVAAIIIALNWIKAIIGIFTFWVNILNTVYKAIFGVAGAIINAFKPAFDWIMKNIKPVLDAINRLNPFARHSPSLVDQVSRGTDEIRKMYSNLFNGVIGTPALAGAAAGSPINNISNNSPVNIKVDMSGIMARSQSDMRDMGKDFISAVNEELRAKGVKEIGA